MNKSVLIILIFLLAASDAAFLSLYLTEKDTVRSLDSEIEVLQVTVRNERELNDLYHRERELIYGRIDTILYHGLDYDDAMVRLHDIRNE
jgi:hypothetical protein